MKSVSLASVIFLFSAFAVLASAADSPVLPSVGKEVTVEIPSGTIIGAVTGVESFSGIPYAEPPVGELRLRPPKRLSDGLGLFNATGKAPACPQMPQNTGLVIIPPLLGYNITPPVPNPNDPPKGQEDCLTVTVQRPKGTQVDANLPVLFYIYGGAFKQDQGFIFVGVNYRVGGFGFLGGAEILKEKSTNLGLRDQRMGLEWVADNIAYFGGDPGKVTIWGHSAGSISVFDQMALYNGNATYNNHSLFRGAFLSSGSVLPTEHVDSDKAQAIFETVVREANCTLSVPQLECLRSLEYSDFYRAANAVPRPLDNASLSYVPRPDGELLVKSPDAIANEGSCYAVPTIITNQEDEGTFFAFTQFDLLNTESLVNYLCDMFFSKATRAQVTGLVDTYPIDSSAGSPFNTSEKNEWYEDQYQNGNGFKRVAAVLGDFIFTLVRRLALEGMAMSHPMIPRW